jgi:TolA-binding protein
MIDRVLLLSICAVLSVVAPARGQDAAQGAGVLRDYFSGNGLLNRGMYDLAAAEYRKFLAEHADHANAPLARYGLAVSLFRLAEYDEAATELAPLRDLPAFDYAAEVIMILGQCALRQGHHEQAATHFRDVVAAHPDHDLADDAAVLEAESLYQAGQYDRVDAPCRLLSAQWPQSPLRERAELLRGMAEMARGEHASSARRFEELSRQFPGGRYQDQASLLRAQSLHHANALPEAAQQYRSVIERGRAEVVPEAMLGLALLSHRQGRLREAGRLLDDLGEQYPEAGRKPEARLLRGRVFFDLGEIDRAQELFERLSSVDGDHGDEAAYWRAKCALRQGNAAEAAQQFRRAIRRFPESELVAQMTYDRAVALIRAGDADEALDVLERFGTEFADHPLIADALHLTATTLHEQRRYGESLELARSFRERYPAHALAPAMAFLAAENEFLRKDYGGAVKAYRSLLRRYPDHEQAKRAQYRLGLALYHLQLFEEAERLLETFADGPDTEPAYRASLLALGDAHFQRGDWEKAVEHLVAYLSFGPDQPLADDALLKLSLARHRRGEVKAALTGYETLLARFEESPHRRQAIFERGQALAALGRNDEAAACFRQVLLEDSSLRFAPHALSHLGAIALQREDYLEAAAYYGRAAEADPGQGEAGGAAEALFQQGQALMSAQRFEPAAAVLSRLVGTYPSHERVGQAAALGAVALARQGDHERALAEIERVEAEHGSDLNASLGAALLYEKAWCLRGLDRAEDAAEAYRAVLGQSATGPPHDRAMLELAELEFEAKRYGEAAGLLRRLHERLAESSAGGRDLREQCTYRLGLCEFRLDNDAAAADLLEAFVGAFPDSPLVASASLLCGEALFKLGRHERAAAQLDRVVERYESDEAYGPSLLRLGECRAALQHWPRSERAFKEYLDRLPESRLWYQAQFGIGWALENQGRRADAVEAYRKVVDGHQGPTAARAQFQIGECLFAEGRFEEAVRELLKVDILYAYPEWSAAALYEAGQCFKEMGSPVDARKQFEQVQQRHAETRWAKLASERLAELEHISLPGH